MDGGEILTRVTVWAAVAGYAAGAVAFALSGRRRRWDAAARLVWTAACVALIAHAACAFNYYHGWSHGAAYLDTARQTAEVFKLDWGGGLYVNYFLLAGWALDVGWWWLGGLDAYRRRPWPLAAAWHGFLLFIFFNATVVFKSGPARWAGLCVCLGICSAWWAAARRNLTRGADADALGVAED